MRMSASKTSKSIKKILIDKGITQASIARKLGVTNDAVCKVVNQHSKSKRIAAVIKELTGIAL
jgi:predicted transcriptional regulator